MKHIKRFPMLIMLLLSASFLAGAGLAGADNTYLAYRSGAAAYNPLSWVFQGIKDDVWPWEAVVNKAEAVCLSLTKMSESEQAAASIDNDVIKEPEGETAAAGSPEEETAGNNGGTQEAVQPETETETEAAKEKTDTFETVDESYFDDALFIGDSRTVGLWEYAGMEERADFFCKTSLTIWNVLDKPIVKTEEGEEITVDQALQERSYGKIYLMVGINELGRGNTELFMEEYTRVTQRIRQLQPEALLFVEGIMRVAGEKNLTDPIFNNANINERNRHIAGLANNIDTFYIDVNEAVCDENGDLIAEYTFDQIHLKAAYYEIWKQFLLEHGIVK